MGSSQSNPRKITVDNENAIQVSQEALDRIQAQLSGKPSDQSQPQAHPQPPPQYVPPSFYEPPSVKQEKANEEAYWARRIENLKQAHARINSSMDIEYKKTLKEVNELFEWAEKENVTTKLAPCQEEKAKVLQCYSSNPDKSLVCSVLVNEFNDCVCKSRVAAISAS